MNNRPIVQRGEPAASTPVPLNPSPRILVVDDDADIRRLNAEVLSRSGYQAETAEDGAAAWAALQANGYDLLITDNHMPKVSGVELVKKVRFAHMTLPVILASGDLPTAELKQHPWLQLAATLLKPFNGDELLGTVERVLGAVGRARAAIEPLPQWRNQPLANDLWL